jgi:hypothetical protein
MAQQRNPMNTLLESIFFMKGSGKSWEKTRNKLVQMLNIRSEIVQFFEQVFRFAGRIYQYSVFKDVGKV